MKAFHNKDGKPVLMRMVSGIKENKDYLGEIDGLIGDGDHGMNMNKGFSLFQQRFEKETFDLSEGLRELEKFDLSIIVTTHSVEFLDAIDYYSKYYKINDKCNYYMSVEKDGGFEFQHVEGDLDKIYEKMIRPGLILDKLKYNLEENE